MDDTLKEIRADLREIKSHTIELVKQGAVHNQMLHVHERRSTNLESRVTPLEADVRFFSKVGKLFMSAGGLMTLYSLLQRFLGLH